MLSVAVALCLASSGPFDFYSYGPYETGVPKPDTVLRYELGSRHTTHRDQEAVVMAVTAGSPRAKVIEYGRSTEGRPLRIVVVSSPANMARLEEIQKEHRALAEAKPGAKLPLGTPAVVWINECVHGDETASFESGMALIYNLVASRSSSVTKLLENTVVIVNPVYNPDGHERYVVAYNSIPNGNPEPGTYDRAIPGPFFGRQNHYRFDMNRDRIAMSQVETRQEVAAFLAWNPQVYVDQHGQVETYFFPPVQQSVNVNVGRDRYILWTDVFGKATAKAFDDQGWTYYVRDLFEIYSACYLDSHTTLMGAIGLTHETDGGRVVTQRRSDDTILTLRDGAAKHMTSALAVIESYVKFKSDAVSGASAGEFQRVVLTSPDRRVLKRLAEHLAVSGIKSQFASQSWEQPNAHDYWSDSVGTVKFPAGALVVDMAQSQGPLAKALLEPSSDFEPEFIERQLERAKADQEGRDDAELDGFEFYDSTAWSLPYAYNLAAWWSDSTPAFVAGEPDRPIAGWEFGTVGAYLEYTDQEDVLFVARALQAGIKVSLLTRQSKVGGLDLEPGTFMFLAARNSQGFGKNLVETANKAKVDLRPLPTSYPDEGRHGPGSETVVQLVKPRVGVVYGSAGSLSGGPLWYLMENVFRLPYDSLTTQALNGKLDRYTCLVFPGAVPESPRLSTWVADGGTVVSLEGGMGSLGAEPDALQATTWLPGSFFKAQIKAKSYLGFGYPRPGGAPVVSVPLDGQSFFKTDANSVVTLSEDEGEKKLLSGWAWPETEEELAGVTFVQENRIGRGRLVSFASDPTFRAQYPGLYRLLLNAMILGPGM